MTGRPIKAGVITDMTGPLSFLGMVNANVARMVIDDINAKGGLLGSGSSCILEDSATTDSVAEAKASEARRAGSGGRDLRRHLQLDAAGDQGPRRREGQEALHLPGAVRGPGMPPAHLLYRPGPAQQVEPLIPWLMQTTGAKKFYCPSADYIWPRR